MKIQVQTGLFVVVRSKRKCGNLKSEGRSGKTGKEASVYEITDTGERKMLFTVNGGTFRSMYQSLVRTANRRGFNLPVGVTINSAGGTFIPW